MRKNFTAMPESYGRRCHKVNYLGLVRQLSYEVPDSVPEHGSDHKSDPGTPPKGSENDQERQ
jgi:hypothetical protein